MGIPLRGWDGEQETCPILARCHRMLQESAQPRIRGCGSKVFKDITKRILEKLISQESHFR